MLDKKSLSERDICTKFITPALQKAGWDIQKQVLEEVYFTDGRIHVRGNLATRTKGKRADYLLYDHSNVPVAIIEAKDNNHSVRAGIQQALEYSEILDIPCVFSSNGDGFIFHDKTINEGKIEQELSLDEFPSPEVVWEKYKKYKGIETPEQERIAKQPYYQDSSGRKPRYYQQIAVNRTVEAIAKGQDRIFLVMATGTGKTYAAFQIAYRLWKAGVKKRILFLADRNALIDQAKRSDFKYFKDKMTVVKHRQVDKSYEVYLALYQGISGREEDKNIYRQFSRNFFDLVIIDESHRGSARADSAWHEILLYFNRASHIGLTATPKETKDVSNIEYFGEPIYTYSLKQGIDDGFLAPYRVIRVGLDVDLEGWRPEQNKRDKDGNPVVDRIYNTKDYDKNLVIDERTEIVANKVSEFLKGYDRYAKTIIFCVDIDHAERMRMALANENVDLFTENSKYIMQITGDNDEGKRELDNFTNPEETYPVIATTSELMTTGIDAITCRVIVLDANIMSMTKFKQIIGRGTRISEDFNKMFFTIIDFRNATNLFADPEFDGDPVRVKEIDPKEPICDPFEDEPVDSTPAEPEPYPLVDPEPPVIRDPKGDLGSTPEPRQKIYVNGVDVTVLVTRELYFNKEGKPITISLKDYTKQIITGQFINLEDFLNRWNSSEQKLAIIQELEEQGVMVQELLDAVDREVDLFDLICHVAYDQPPLTRKERANQVKKRNYFTKYGDQARKVLEKLLDKYADEGIENLEDINVLRLQDFNEIGSAYEIIKIFGGRESYFNAVHELENELYKPAM